MENSSGSGSAVLPSRSQPFQVHKSKILSLLPPSDPAAPHSGVPVSAGTCAPSPGTSEQRDAGPRAPTAHPVLPLRPSPEGAARSDRPRMRPLGLPGCPGASEPADPGAHQTVSRAAGPCVPRLAPASLRPSSRCPDPSSPLHPFQPREATTEA